MSTITRLNAKFGHAAIVPVEKVAYHKRTLTSAVNEMLIRLDATIAKLEGITDLRRTKKDDCKAPMAYKYKGNLIIKIGYGERNAKIIEELDFRAFTSLADALGYLQELRKMIINGELDQIIADHIKKLSDQAIYAISCKSDKADENTNGEPIVRETVITPAANLKVVK